MLPTRDDALALVHEYTASDSLRKHMLSVEAAMRAYAEQLRRGRGALGRWPGSSTTSTTSASRTTPTRPRRSTPREGVRILRARGWPEDILEAVLGHAHYTGVPRATPMAKTLFAVDELTGLITATALVRPSRSVHDVEARSVRKKMKDKAFARGVSREDVMQGAAALGVDLDEHIAFVIAAMQRVGGLPRPGRHSRVRAVIAAPTLHPGWP